MIIDKPVNLEQLTKEAKIAGMGGPGHGAITTDDGVVHIFCYIDTQGNKCVVGATNVSDGLCDICKAVYDNHQAMQTVTRESHIREHTTANPARQRQLESILLGVLPAEKVHVTDTTPKLVT